jgi:predicted nucleotidyltransferase
VGRVLTYNNFFSGSNLVLEKQVGPYYHDELNPVFWTKKTKNDETEWIFDSVVRRKLLRIADDFFESYSDILKEKDIVDVQLTGSIANFNYTNLSDLDVHIIVNLDGIDDENPKILKSALDGIRFIWNLRHNIKIRGYDVELYVQDAKEPHISSGLFSLLNNEWVKNPVYDPPSVDEQDVNKKWEGIAYEIDQLHTRLLSLPDLPKNAKDLYKRASKLKEKIMKMRKEGLSKEGEFSVGNLAFKKLRNEGYIEKLINLTASAYDKIYTEN